MSIKKNGKNVTAFEYIIYLYIMSLFEIIIVMIDNLKTLRYSERNYLILCKLLLCSTCNCDKTHTQGR